MPAKTYHVIEIALAKAANEVAKLQYTYFGYTSISCSREIGGADTSSPSRPIRRSSAMVRRLPTLWLGSGLGLGLGLGVGLGSGSG